MNRMRSVINDATASIDPRDEILARRLRDADELIDALSRAQHQLLAEIVRVREALGFYARGEHLCGNWSAWRPAEEPGWLDPPDGSCHHAIETGALASEALSRKPRFTYRWMRVRHNIRCRSWVRLLAHRVLHGRYPA